MAKIDRDIKTNIYRKAYDQFLKALPDDLRRPIRRAVMDCFLKVMNKQEFLFEPVKNNIQFNDQYKHPNWQKMRLTVLKRDGFKCVNCGSRDRMLHAHHVKYKKGGFIWDVPHWYIITLCDECHSKEHNKNLRAT